MEYYSDTKKDGIMPSAAMWMQLDIIILSEMSEEERQIPCDPAIPLLGVHTKETRIKRDMCTPMFIAALFTIARTWKQSRCPLTDE